jgi:hypothetical protein
VCSGKTKAFTFDVFYVLSIDFKGIKKYILNIENRIFEVGGAKGDAVLSGIKS